MTRPVYSERTAPGNRFLLTSNGPSDTRGQDTRDTGGGGQWSTGDTSDPGSPGHVLMGDSETQTLFTRKIRNSPLTPTVRIASLTSFSRNQRKLTWFSMSVEIIFMNGWDDQGSPSLLCLWECPGQAQVWRYLQPWPELALCVINYQN